jgi:hypothetical protein
MDSGKVVSESKMSKRLRVSVEELKLRLPEEVELDENTYSGMSSRARFVDRDFGEFWALPKDVCRGHGHRRRGSLKIAMSKRTPAEAVVAALPDYIVLDVATYVSKHEPARFVDKEFGEWWACPKEVLRGHTLHRKRALQLGQNIKLSAADVMARLPGHISLDASSYVNTAVKARFVDADYGEWWVTPNQVLFGSHHPERAKENRKRTCIARYGVEHVTQSREMFVKGQKTKRKTVHIKHWKTGETLVCVGSYEKAVVEWLNKEETEFSWQIPFVLSGGRVYYCDLYLHSEDKYVEIKGWWMQEVSRRKWMEFHSTHPNSELWDRPKLKSMGLIKR